MATENTVAQVYEYLKHAVAADTSKTAVPATSVRKYVGSLDEHSMFHGEGVLYSAMGFRYEGNFVHGSMEGEGQIVWNNGISYQGEFHDNSPNGKGIFTWSNGDKYVGDVKNGVRHGNGEMSTARGLYTGFWVSGKRHGKGHQTYGGESFYDGEWAGDKRHGRGKLVYPNGDVYDGGWEKGRRDGFGVMGWKFGTAHYLEVYEGHWSDDIPQGHGRSTYVLHLDPDNAPADIDTPVNYSPPISSVVNVYEGEFVQGMRHGFGVFYYADGGTYEGEWCRGNKEGHGKCKMSVGASYYGIFRGNEAEQIFKDAETPATLPSIALDDFFGISDKSLEETKTSMRMLLVRFNKTLRNWFDTYSGKFDNVKLLTTKPNWWQHRFPGHICIPQYLRMLNDAHIINGRVSIYDVMKCVLLTIEKEVEVEAYDAAPHSPWGERMHALQESLLRLEGNLNYRQFVESLVRLSAIACVGFNVTELAQRFAMLMEGSLTQGQRTSEPLCPLTREHEVQLLPLLPSLEALFLRIGTEAKTQPRGTFVLLSVRNFIMFFRTMFNNHGISLIHVVNCLFPFDRFKTPGVVPTVVCSPRNALGFSMYERSCGSQGELAAVVVASERLLTFVEFVEAVLGALCLVGVTDEKDMFEKLQEILVAKSS
ncbi:hypothetical protein TraAM80_09630 [Trypanosoma rangeli]|uniref:Phosphatidylinositol-4-phosphate 5-kinase n=1 Tax=Trypanosoma rangeli TaxID=5698 RepID=A0A3R7LGF2_TRYRA|nr:uncharacterized protein TraAM80_09630 [Trypanosoma rangeli]RNE96794.1 hypothetical protein TraAM80_09630 [Trypanosoma rangeli]|eukprot:RNE96794.1 hypothetical protein TraAM80_09630 [Trypanosoma rangeli]